MVRALTLDEKFYGYSSVEDIENYLKFREEWMEEVGKEPPYKPAPKAVINKHGHLYQPFCFADYVEGWCNDGNPFEDSGEVYWTTPEHEYQLHEEIKEMQKDILFLDLYFDHRRAS